MPATREQKVRAIAALIDVIYSCVKEAGKQGIPNGHLYAMLMEKGMTYDLYSQIIQTMKENGKIEENFNLLTVAD